MTKYNIDGNDVDVPDGWTAEQAAKAYVDSQAQEETQQASPESTPAQQQDPTKINPADLKNDPDYVHAAKTWFKMNNGADFDRSDEEAADYGKKQMALFNYNTVDSTFNALRLMRLNDEQKKAFLYMLNASDHYDWSWEGTGNALAAMAIDPINWSGLITLGAGTAEGQAIGAGARYTARTFLRNAVTNGLMGGAYGAGMDSVRQVAEINAGGKDEFDKSELLKSTAMNSLFGSALGVGATALGMAGTKLRRPVERPPVDITPLDHEVGTPTVNTVEHNVAPPTPRTIDHELADVGYSSELLGKMTDEQKQNSLNAYHVSRKQAEFQASGIEGDWRERQDVIKELEGDVASGRVILPDNPNPVPLKERGVYSQGTLNKAESEVSEWGQSQGLDRAGTIDSLREDLGRGVTSHETEDGTRVFLKDLIDHMEGSKGTVDTSTATFNERLEKGLAGAKPRYNYGSAGFGLDFESDIEKALFITSQKNKSKADEGYRQFLRNNGYTDNEIDRLGQDVRDHIKGLAGLSKGSDLERLHIGKIVDRKAPKEAFATKPIEPGTEHEPGTNMVPENGTGNKVLDAVINFAKEGGTEADTDAAKAAAETVKGLTDGDVQAMQNQISRFGLTNDQRAMSTTIRETAQALIDKTREMVKAGVAMDDPQLQHLEALRDKAVAADTALSSQASKELSDRIGKTNTNENRGLTAESVLAERGIDADKATAQQVLEARQEVYKRYTDIEAEAKLNEDVQRLDKLSDDLMAQGDLAGAVRANTDRTALQAAVAEKKAQSQGMGTTLAQNGNTVTNALMEYVIGQVMSTGTLVRIVIPSLVQTVYRPFTDMLARGADYASIRQMVSTYSSMLFLNEFANQMTNPFRSAFQTGRYESHFLTTDMDRFFERPIGAIPRWAGGGVIRMIPRMVETLDEFFKQIHYRGAVVGQATGDAIKEAFELGMTKDHPDFEAHIQGRVQQAVDKSFAPDIDTPRVIDFLRRQGISNGKTGDVLDKWIATELRKNADLFREAQNQTAKNYSDDILFKRQFSGEDNISKGAEWYEKGSNMFPMVRLLGQLFFRTPVRLLEMGVNITPGLNAVAGSMPFVRTSFIKDVRGLNGEFNQTKGLGSVLAAYGIMSSFMYNYAQGKITGGGPEKSAERRQLENTGEFKPYSYKMADGSFFGFGRIEPFNMPFKLMANVMERYGTLRQRQMQGEFVDNEYKRLEGLAAVVFGSIAQTIHDSGTLEGISQWMDVGNILKDPSKEDNQMQKLIGQKLTMLIPHTYLNYQKSQHPELSDPVTVNQWLRAALNPADPLVARQFDPLGNVRKNQNPLSNLIGLDISSPEHAKMGLDERDSKLNTWLADIETHAGVSFQAPHKIDYPGFDQWKGKDLRTEYTADGKDVLYNKWNEEYNKLGVRDQLERLFTKGGDRLKMGTPDNHGPLTEGALQIIHENRQLAFTNMVRKDQELYQKMRQGIDHRVDKLRQPDVQFNPYDIRRQPF